MSQVIPLTEVAKHNTKGDCWVVIHGKVYDVTSFLADHPGGSKIILKYAGGHADDGFDMVHSTDIIEQWEPPPALVGVVADSERAVQAEQKEFKPLVPLSHVLNVFDFERLAEKMMTWEGWCYYSSGADDERSLAANMNVFSRIGMRPRVLVDVSHADPSSHMLGTPVSFPMYTTATALARLAHPDAECAITKAAGTEGIIQMMPTLASASLDDMLGAKIDGQTQWLQLYVNQDRNRALKFVKRAEKAGVQALCITVDAPQLGRRELDMRNKFSSTGADVNESDINRSSGTAAAITAFIDPSLSWKDITWFQERTSMKIMLKGIQTWEDAVMADEAGCAGIILSNHGGRQLDYAPTAMEILPEVMEKLRERKSAMEVYVDGGIRRGTDIFKALAMGATGVGVGRPIIYALASHGEAGVRHCIRLLKDEFTWCMKLMGVTDISQISRSHVNLKGLLNGVPQQAYSSPMARTNIITLPSNL